MNRKARPLFPLQSKLIKHALTEIEFNRLYLFECETPEEFLKTVIVIRVHEALTEAIELVREENPNEYLKWLFGAKQLIYEGKRVLTVFGDIGIPPEEIHKALGKEGMFKIVRTYFDMMNTHFQELNARGEL